MARTVLSAAIEGDLMLKAVIVGINDYAAAPLAGCINDAEDVIAYMTRRGALDENIVPLYDGRATRTEIVAALEALVAHSTAGDHLLFHYSGHGSQIPSTSSEEADSFDECLCPLDFTWDDPSTAIRDKDLATILAKVPHDVAMTVVLDSCHSGDMRRDPISLSSLAAPPKSVRRAYPMPLDLQRRLLVSRKIATRTPVRILASNVIVVSACQSNQTAADTEFGGRPNGAFTYYWYDAIYALQGAPLTALLSKCKPPLHSYAMTPMLDGSLDLLQKNEFLVDPPPLGEKVSSPNMPRTMTLVFDETYDMKSLDAALEVRLASGDGEFRFVVTRRGSTPTQWTFPVANDLSYDLECERDSKLVFSVRRWKVAGGTASFDLSVRVVASRTEAVVVEKSVGPRGRKTNGASRDADDATRVP
ncbi:MAG: caspase domain-containing protein [Kofleriaceae bacterium]